MGEQTRHLTASEVSERLGIPEYSIYAMAREGELPCLRIGRRVRFRLKDLERWEESKVEGSPSTEPTEG